MNPKERIEAIKKIKSRLNKSGDYSFRYSGGIMLVGFRFDYDDRIDEIEIIECKDYKQIYCGTRKIKKELRKR